MKYFVVRQNDWGGFFVLAADRLSALYDVIGNSEILAEFKGSWVSHFSVTYLLIANVHCSQVQSWSAPTTILSSLLSAQKHYLDRRKSPRNH